MTTKESSINDGSRVKSIPQAKEEHMALWSQPMCRRCVKSCHEGHLSHPQGAMSIQMEVFFV